MLKKLLATVIILSAVVIAQGDNPYASVVWTKNNVPNGCFPHKGGSMMLCEDYQDADNRSMKIVDAVNNMMYIYVKMNGRASTLNVSHCNNLMAVPNKTDKQTLKELSEGKTEGFLELVVKSTATGEWGWNCMGARSIKNVFCILNGTQTHYIKVTKYDEMGLIDSEKETTGTSPIGDFCRDRFDGL